MSINNKNNKNNKNLNKNLNKNFYGEKVGILELTLKDFKYKNNKLYITNDYFSEKKGFIIFYAPWCQHCKKKSDLFINLALDNINLFNFGSVNYENIEMKNDLLCLYANIREFPTIKYIKSDGTLEDYKYSYDADNLIYFINTNI